MRRSSTSTSMPSFSLMESQMRCFVFVKPGTASERSCRVKTSLTKCTPTSSFSAQYHSTHAGLATESWYNAFRMAACFSAASVIDFHCS